MISIEEIRARLFDKDNHSLEVIEEIEKQLIEYLRLEHSIEENDLVKFTIIQARKKYQHWYIQNIFQDSPKRNKVNSRTAEYLRDKFEDKEKEGLLE